MRLFMEPAALSVPVAATYMQKRVTISIAVKWFEILKYPTTHTAHNIVLSYFLWQSLLLSRDNLIECELNIARVEYKHLAQGDTLGLM